LFNAVIGDSVHLIDVLIRSGADASIRSPDLGSVLEYAHSIGLPNAVVEALRLASPSKKKRG
jgi:hypothetical protein